MSGVTNFPSSAWSNRPTSRRSRAGRGEFLDFDPEFEMGHWVAAAPSVDFPARLKELDFSDLAKVERGGRHALVELLREPEQHLVAPARSVLRPPDGNVQRLLLNDVRDAEDELDELPGEWTELEGRPRTVGLRDGIRQEKQARAACGRRASAHLRES